MSEPIRVLQMAPIRMGGITEMVLNIAENMDPNKVSFDYLTFIDTFENASNRAEQAGGAIYRVDLQNIRNPIIRGVRKFTGIVNLIRKNNFQVVHINTSTPYEVLVAVAAKVGGAKKIIFHSHNSSFYPGQKLANISSIFKVIMLFFVTEYIACSEEAAKFMFPKKILMKHNYIVLKNGINVEKFKYKNNVRLEYRKRFGLENNFVLGNVGRFNVQKNHTFLIDIFAEVYRKDKTAKLFLVGIGETEEDIKKKVYELGLSDAVVFHGISKEVDNLLQIMDIFVMPSLYEGLPVAGVEVQGAGLPIVLSDTVTKELMITNAVSYVSLNAPISNWVEQILKYKGYTRKDKTASITRAGFNIEDTANVLTKMYIDE